MASLSIESLRSETRAELILPGDAAYEPACRVWNGMVRKRPALVVRCTGVADVVAALQFARANDRLVAIRGGGHNVAGNAVCDDGIVVDLSPMKGIRVDAAAHTVRAQGGVTWGELDREAQLFGLATTGGLVSTTGIAGLTLGGGIGWLARKYGLACDNLISADIVDAQGRVLVASTDENPDLFWAIRGGGGNFGVVTSLEYALHPVGPVVFAGALFHPIERARDVLQYYREYVADLPDELTSAVFLLTGPPAPFLPPALHGAPLLAIAALHCGAHDEAASLLQPLRSFGPPVVDLFGPMPYLALQSMFDATAPSGLQNYWRSESLDSLGDRVIDILLEHFANVPSPIAHVDVHHLAGAVARVAAGTTAFSNRSAPFILNIIGMWEDREQDDRGIRWVRELSDAIRPHATGAVYVNFLGEEGDARVRSAYGAPEYERLAALKKKYDPTNVFRFNQNVRPA